MLGLEVKDCIIFEDSAAGVEAALRGAMKAVGIDSQTELPEADNWITGFQYLPARKFWPV